MKWKRWVIGCALAVPVVVGAAWGGYEALKASECQRIMPLMIRGGEIVDRFHAGLGFLGSGTKNPVTLGADEAAEMAIKINSEVITPIKRKPFYDIVLREAVPDLVKNLERMQKLMQAWIELQDLNKMFRTQGNLGLGTTSPLGIQLYCTNSSIDYWQWVYKMRQDYERDKKRNPEKYPSSN